MAAAPGWAPGCVNLWFLCVWFFFFACARRRLPFLNFWGGGKAAVSFGLSGGCAALGWRRRWGAGVVLGRRSFVRAFFVFFLVCFFECALPGPAAL